MPETTSDKLAKAEAFEAVKVHRSQLQNAPYNPRVIDAHARKKLKGKLSKVGLVQPLVWNRRTGNLVSGHQRLSIIDDLEGSRDYCLTVAAVDLDEKAERETNVFLNNTSAMGSWDAELLEALVRDATLDLPALGFDPTDLQILLDAQDLSPILDNDKDKAAPDIERLSEMKRKRREYKQAAATRDDPEFFFVLVFEGRAQANAFAKALRLPTETRYIDGVRLAADAGIDLSDTVNNRSLPTTGAAGTASASESSQA